MKSDLRITCALPVRTKTPTQHGGLYPSPLHSNHSASLYQIQKRGQYLVTASLHSPCAASVRGRWARLAEDVDEGRWEVEMEDTGFNERETAVTALAKVGGGWVEVNADARFFLMEEEKLTMRGRVAVFLFAPLIVFCGVYCRPLLAMAAASCRCLRDGRCPTR